MRFLFKTLPAFLLCLLAFLTKAQEKSEINSPVTYILPDGRAIGADKLDSIRKVWGADKVIMRHNDQDDSKKIIHLEQETDKMLQDMAANSEAQIQTLKAMIGKTATDFTLTDLKGHQVQLSQLKGKVVVVNFWFSACPPCIDEMPELNQLVKEYSRQGVVFLAITFNDSKTIDGFLKEHDFKYEIFPKSINVIHLYKIHNYPTHLVIGKDGILKQYFLSGEHIKADLMKAIREQISQKSKSA